MNDTTICVIGGGPAGIVCAAGAARAGATVHLLEGRDVLGGLHRSVEIDGLHYDMGTVLFDDEHHLLRLLPSMRAELVETEYRPMSITPTGAISKYPFSLAGYARHHGLGEVARVAASVAAAKVRYRSRATSLDFARYYMGDRLLTRSGFGAYAERFNGMGIDEVDVRFAEYRLRALARYGLRATAVRAVGAARNRGSASAIVKSRLVRPAGGMGPLYAAAQRDLDGLGVDVRLGAPVVAIDVGEPISTVRAAGGPPIEADLVVSTIAPPTAVRLCGLEPAGAVEHRDLHSLHLRGELGAGHAVLFNFTHEGRWKRLTNFRAFYGGDEDWITIETTVAPGESADDEAIRDEVVDSLRLAGLSPSLEVAGSTVVPAAYPLYRPGFQAGLDRLQAQLDGLGVLQVGRQGRHEYQLSSYVAERAETFVWNELAGAALSRSG